MGKTSIEWTRGDDGTEGKTWNPVRGCSRVSEGCRNCYAERQAARFAKPAPLGQPETTGNRNGPFYGFVTKVNGHAAWTGKVELIERHLLDPLKWRKPTRIFVNSMTDLFHEALPDEAIDRVFAVMALADQHTYMILTKRAKRMREYFADEYRWAYIEGQAQKLYGELHPKEDWESIAMSLAVHGPLKHVQLGVSVENQKYADERIVQLLFTEAAIRFVSYEPALGPVNFRRIEHEPEGSGGTVFIDSLEGKSFSVGGSQILPKIDLVIVGGESGPGARPFDIAWARSTVKQCADTKTACFVKQLGAVAVSDVPLGKTYDDRFVVAACQGIKSADGKNRYTLQLWDRKGGDMDEWPSDLRVRQFPGVR